MGGRAHKRVEHQAVSPYETTKSPQGWHWRTIGDLCAEDRTLIEPDSVLARELPYISLEHIESVTGRILRKASVNIEDEVRSVTFRFDARHVLYGKLRPYLNKVALPDFEGRCTTELIPLLPRSDVSREFLAWLLRRPQTVEAAMREKTGARMPRADMRHILSLRLLIPDRLEDQKQIADDIAARMALIAEAKAACQEQLQLLDTYAHKILADFL
jgi:type I restriction enzyme S subunit